MSPALFLVALFFFFHQIDASCNLLYSFEDSNGGWVGGYVILFFYSFLFVFLFLLISFCFQISSFIFLINASAISSSLSFLYFFHIHLSLPYFLSTFSYFHSFLTPFQCTSKWLCWLSITKWNLEFARICHWRTIFFKRRLWISFLLFSFFFFASPFLSYLALSIIFRFLFLPFLYFFSSHHLMS